MAQIAKLYVHADRWTSMAIPSATLTVWTAQRPLVGEVMWEGPNVGYGRHFAATPADHERMAYFTEANRRDDAREVILLTNTEAIIRATGMAEQQGRAAYGIVAYLNAYPGREGAKMFVETYDLPWSEDDLTADAMIASLSGGAA